MNKISVVPKLHSVIGIGLLCGLLGAGVASAQVDPDSVRDVSEQRASIWSETVFDPKLTAGSGGLNTSDSESDGRQEPILVPLPAPVLAAGTGLGLAWILRKRMTRV